MADDTKPDTKPDAPKSKVAAPSEEPYVMQRVTNDSPNIVAINTQTGQQMLNPGDTGEAMIHVNEGKTPPLVDGLKFETI